MSFFSRSTPPAPEAPAPAPKPAGLPSSNVGASDPPPPQGKMNAQQLRSYFRSPEYLALPAEKQM